MKTLVGDTNHLNTQTLTEAYKIRHNEQMKSTDSGAEVIGSKQIQIDRNCDVYTETLIENASCMKGLWITHMVQANKNNNTETEREIMFV